MATRHVSVPTRNLIDVLPSRVRLSHVLALTIAVYASLTRGIANARRQT
jgi:hypothetical protein